MATPPTSPPPLPPSPLAVASQSLHAKPHDYNPWPLDHLGQRDRWSTSILRSGRPKVPTRRNQVHILGLSLVIGRHDIRDLEGSPCYSEGFDIGGYSESLQTIEERWRQFKSYLTRKWALAPDKDSVDDTVCETYDISKEKWAQFCQTRKDPSWEDVQKKAQASRSKTPPPTCCLVGNLMTEKIKKKLEEAAQSESTEGVIDPPSPITREVEDWVDDDSLEEQASQGSFVPHGRQDLLTAAIRRPEHLGRVRASRAARCSPSCNHRSIHRDLHCHWSLRLVPQLLVSEKYENPSRPVALGRLYEGSTAVHNIPLLHGQVKVGVEEVKDVEALVPVPTTEVILVVQALNTFLAWLTHLVKRLSKQVHDPLYLMTLTIPQLFLKPLQVMWDATVFGMFNEHFSLYIKHEDPSEIARSGQCLSISVIKLWILHLTETSMRARNSDVYGFLKPQSIQRSGQSQFKSESYMKSWMQSSQRDVYLGAYLNSALKGLDDTPQPKSKAAARWIVVKTIGSREIEGTSHPVGTVLSQSLKSNLGC
ncbi:hypothetical protein HKD37_01G000804 [Glycine soja]